MLPIDGRMGAAWDKRRTGSERPNVPDEVRVVGRIKSGRAGEAEDGMRRAAADRTVRVPDVAVDDGERTVADRRELGVSTRAGGDVGRDTVAWGVRRIRGAEREIDRAGDVRFGMVTVEGRVSLRVADGLGVSDRDVLRDGVRMVRRGTEARDERTLVDGLTLRGRLIVREGARDRLETELRPMDRLGAEDRELRIDRAGEDRTLRDAELLRPIDLDELPELWPIDRDEDRPLERLWAWAVSIKTSASPKPATTARTAAHRVHFMMTTPGATSTFFRL